MRVDIVSFLDFDDPEYSASHPPKLPKDYYAHVEPYGDTYRDTFTRGCAYLSGTSVFDTNDMIVIATDIGNIEALELFEASCKQEGGVVPSAVHFALATTSTAATSLNMMKQVRGGNLTINAARRSLESGLLAASLFLDNNPTSSAHVFFSVRKSRGAWPPNFFGKLFYLRIVADERNAFGSLSFANAMARQNTDESSIFVLEDELEFFQLCRDGVPGGLIHLRSESVESLIYGRREVFNGNYPTFY